MPLSEKALQNKRKYNIKYTKNHYKRVPLDLTPSQYQATKTAADSVNESVNGFIKSSISDRLEKLTGEPLPDHKAGSDKQN